MGVVQQLPLLCAVLYMFFKRSISFSSIMGLFGRADKYFLISSKQASISFKFSSVKVNVEISKEAKADFVKTSTGFSTGGAIKEDIALMRKTVGTEMGVKASGGVKTKEDALEMIKLGVKRIGTSSAKAIADGVETSGSY